MKIILSHDVDHITAWEHVFKDTLLPRFIIRNHLELLAGKISGREYLGRWADLCGNQWNAVDELMRFEQARQLKSNWFIGVNNGLGLSYPLSQAVPVLRKLIANGFEVGVHGIEFADFKQVEQERATFARVSGLSRFGIRMHYLRCNPDTLGHIARAGYAYDATESGFQNPCRRGTLWEFPLQIMDIWVINGQKRWQTRTFEQARQEMLAQIEAAKHQGLKYLSILFHDRYFLDSFATWKTWFVWLVDYLLEQGYEFVTYEQAIAELQQQADAPRACEHVFQKEALHGTLINRTAAAG